MYICIYIYRVHTYTCGYTLVSENMCIGHGYLHARPWPAHGGLHTRSTLSGPRPGRRELCHSRRAHHSGLLELRRFWHAKPNPTSPITASGSLSNALKPHEPTIWLTGLLAKGHRNMRLSAGFSRFVVKRGEVVPDVCRAACFLKRPAVLDEAHSG